MQLSELQRLNLENIQLKRKLIESDFLTLQNEVSKLNVSWNKIIDAFCKENELDKEKIQINLQTGEVTQGG